MKKLLTCVLLFAVGCGPTTTDKLGGPNNPIGASSLVDTYKSFPSEARELYTSKLVTVRFTQGHYKVHNRVIHWYTTGDRNLPATIIVTCPFDPGNPSSDLMIAGKCRGRVWDGIDRGDNVRFSITIEADSIAEIKLIPE